MADPEGIKIDSLHAASVEEADEDESLPDVSMPWGDKEDQEQLQRGQQEPPSSTIHENYSKENADDIISSTEDEEDSDESHSDLKHEVMDGRDGEGSKNERDNGTTEEVNGDNSARSASVSGASDSSLASQEEPQNITAATAINNIAGDADSAPSATNASKDDNCQVNGSIAAPPDVGNCMPVCSVQSEAESGVDVREETSLRDPEAALEQESRSTNIENSEVASIHSEADESHNDNRKPKEAEEVDVAGEEPQKQCEEAQSSMKDPAPFASVDPEEANVLGSDKIHEEPEASDNVAAIASPDHGDGLLSVCDTNGKQASDALLDLQDVQSEGAHDGDSVANESRDEEHGSSMESAGRAHADAEADADARSIVMSDGAEFEITLNADMDNSEGNVVVQNAENRLPRKGSNAVATNEPSDNNRESNAANSVSFLDTDIALSSDGVEVSVDTSHETAVSLSADGSPKTVSEAMHKRRHDKVDDKLRAPNGGRKSRQSPASASANHFKRQREPDGDCEFLDRTLNITAGDTSAQDSYPTTDLPNLVTSTISEESKDEYHEDTPRYIMGNESKLTADHSHILSRIAESNDAKEKISHHLVDSFSVSLRSTHEFDSYQSLLDNHDGNDSVASLTSYMSAQQSIEVVCNESSSPPMKFRDWQPMSPGSLDYSCTSDKVSKDRTALDPLLSRLASTAVGANGAVRSERCEDNSPMARMRYASDRSAADPEGTVISKELDPTLLGGIRKPSSSRRPQDRPRPKVSFAAIHKGPHNERDERSAAPHGHNMDDSGPDDRDEKRRAKFAAYLRRRMIDFDDDEEDDDDYDDDLYDDHDDDFITESCSRKARCQDGIPGVLDPSCCASVESSFTTLLSRADTADDGSTVFSALDAVVGAPQSKDEDSGSDSSSCCDSYYSDGQSTTVGEDGDREEEDTKSTSFFPSFFPVADTTQDTAALDAIPKWCEDMVLKVPSVPQIEGLLKAAANFGSASRNQKVTQVPHNVREHELEQEALTEFVDELEDETSFKECRTDTPRDSNQLEPKQQTIQEPSQEHPQQTNQQQLEESLQEPIEHVKEEATQETSHDPDEGSIVSELPQKAQTTAQMRCGSPPVFDLASTLSTEIQQECGVLTLADFHELVMMAAEAIDVSAKKSESKKPKMKKRNLDLNNSTDSTEAAWENVELTVSDLDGVTGPTRHEKPTAQEKIAAKLEHIKKNQPQVYKVFLAKMAAAERSVRTTELRRDEVVRNVSTSKEAERLDTHTTKESTDQQNIKSSVHAPRIKAERKLTADWESLSFDGSQFKDFKMARALEDEDFKWLRSAKDSFTSTMESFLGAPRTNPFKSGSTQDRKTHPAAYRSTLSNVFEMDNNAPKASSANVDKLAAPASNVKSGTTQAAQGSITNIDARDNNVEKTKPNIVSNPTVKTSPDNDRVIPESRATDNDNNARQRSLATAEKRQSIADATSSAPLASPDQGSEKPALGLVPVTNAKGEHAVACSTNNVHPQTPMISETGEPTQTNFANWDARNMTAQSNEDEEVKAQGNNAPDGDVPTKVQQKSHGKNAPDEEVPAKAQQERDGNDAPDEEVSAKAQQKRDGNYAPTVKDVFNNPRSSSKVSMFVNAFEKRQTLPLAAGPSKEPSAAKLSRAGGRAEELLVKKVDFSLQKKPSSMLDRSKTPLSSNRGGVDEAKHTKTPKSSNRSEATHKRPTVLPVEVLSQPRRPSKPEISAPENASTNSSQWESFENSNFKDFVMQSFSGAAKEGQGIKKSVEKKLSQGSKQEASSNIDLETTFLDSILPPPPSFTAASEAHNQQQKDPFIEAAEEQWEHFSPLSFDPNFTKWGVAERPRPSVSKVAKSQNTRCRTSTNKSSPSSVAEF